MDLRKSIGSQTDFALRHAGSLLAGGGPNAGRNAVFSTASVHAAVGLVAAGARGPTLDQALAVLRSEAKEELGALVSQVVGIILADGSAAGGPCLAFVNGVWVDASLRLKPSFEEVVHGTYMAVSRSVDFQTKAIEVKNDVNSWAEKETNGLIKELLPDGSVDHSTKLIFANALYFKGAWKDKFDVSKTKDSDFHLLDGNKVQVPFMTSKKKQFVSAFDGFKVLTLPYNRGEDRRQFSMYFLLPDAKDGLHALVQKMSSEPGFLDRHIPLQEVEVGDLRIPKFKISFGFEASANLKNLGLVLPFMGGDLSEMVDSPTGKNLYVSSIHHKSFIEVNEEGTEAAAASAAVVLLRALLVAGPVDFVADHPFLFLIREEMTGVVLFVGQVVNPSQPS